jgi:hypothetical protein
MSKKYNDAKRRKKEEDRKKRFSKKNLYHQKHANKDIGDKELETYKFIYHNLNKEYRIKFKDPENKPNSVDYQLIRKFYYSNLNGNSIDSKF